VAQGKPPEGHQVRNQSFDFYLFNFLAVAYPVFAALLFFTGMRAMTEILRRKDRFPSFNAFLFLYMIGASSYFLSTLQFYSSTLVHILSLTLGVISFAALARLRELKQNSA
jgi:hypothetical protein